MITEQDLQEAIAECEGQRNPNANTCIKLAAFYILKDHLFPPQSNGYADVQNTMYSYALGKGVDADVDEPEKISYESDTQFSRLINNRAQDDVWPIMDELMTALQVVEPRLYAGVLRKLEA